LIKYLLFDKIDRREGICNCVTYGGLMPSRSQLL